MKTKVSHLMEPYRDENGLSQAQAAEQLGISTQSWSRFERGVRYPSYRTTIALGEMMDFDFKSVTSIEDYGGRVGTLTRISPPLVTMSPEDVAKVEDAKKHGDPVSTAQALLYYRTINGFSQETAFREAEIKPSQWPRWEQGKAFPYPKDRAKIEKLTGLKLLNEY